MFSWIFIPFMILVNSEVSDCCWRTRKQQFSLRVDSRCAKLSRRHWPTFSRICGFTPICHLYLTRFILFITTCCSCFQFIWLYAGQVISFCFKMIFSAVSCTISRGILSLISLEKVTSNSKLVQDGSIALIRQSCSLRTSSLLSLPSLENCPAYSWCSWEDFYD